MRRSITIFIPFFRLTPALLFIVLAFSLGSCGGGGGGDGDTGNPGPTDIVVASVAVKPGGALLTSLGDSQALRAEAYNASDELIPGVSVAWTSNDSATVGIDGNGLITANASLGSAQVTATVDGVDSIPATILVAHPVPTALLINDSEVVVSPTLVDPNADLELGLQFIVTLDGTTTTEVGAIIIGTGAEPIGGVVVAREVQGDGSVVVTYEVVPLDNLFSSLEFKETYELSKFPWVLGEQAALVYDLEILPGDIAQATLKTLAPATSGGGTLFAQPAAAFNLGIFSCEATSTPPFSLTNNPGTIRITTTASLTVNFILPTPTIVDLEMVRLDGDIKADYKAELAMTSTLSGEVKCDAKNLVSRTIILTGPVFILSPTISAGPNFALGGSVQTQNIGFELTAEATADGFAQLLCPGAELTACAFSADYNSPSPKTDYKVDLPDPNSVFGLKLQPTLSAGVTGAVSFGLPPDWTLAQSLLGNLTLEAAKASLGLKQSGDLAFAKTQVDDGGYASQYDLKYEWEVAAGEQLATFVQFISTVIGVAIDSSVSGEGELGRSPVANSVRADKDTFMAGEQVTFNVNLNSSTTDYPFINYNVDRVKIYRKNSFGMIDELADVAATINQTGFFIPWTANANGSIAAEEYYAFITTNALPLPGVGEFELGKVDNTAPSDVTGRWVGGGSIDDVSDEDNPFRGASVHADLIVTDSNLSGAADFSVSEDYCVPPCNGEISGQISGNQILLGTGIAFVGQESVTFTGEIAPDGNHMSGRHSYGGPWFLDRE